MRLDVKQRAILISHTPPPPLPECESGLAGQRNLLLALAPPGGRRDIKEA